MAAEKKKNPTWRSTRIELRERLRRLGLKDFTDVEALRLLLGFAMTRRSAGPVSRELIEKYGCFDKVLNAPEKELLKIPMLDKDSVTLLMLARDLPRFYLKRRVMGRTGTKYSHPEMLNYLNTIFCGKRNEQFRVFFLDTQQRILCEEKVSEGTLDHHVVYPRKVIERAIMHNAASLIFAHNHPAGAPRPSLSDKEITRRLVEAARLLDMEVLDHYIITCDGWYSFRDHRMI